MTRNVVVTGLGVVSSIGTDVDAFWNGLSSGQCGIKQDTYSIEELSITLPGGRVHGIDERLDALGHTLKRVDRVSQFAVLAADEAIASSGLEFDDGLSVRTACIIGSGIGGTGQSRSRLLRHAQTWTPPRIR